MSTKIYNAYATRSSLRTVMDAAKALSAAALAQHRRLTDAIMTKPRKPMTALELVCARLSIIGWHAMSVKRGDNDFNPNCSLVIYPRAKGRGCIVQMFGVLRELEGEFIDNIKGADFHYQNQCDRPDEVSAQQWAARKREWDAILVGRGLDGIPSHHGFSFDLINDRSGLESTLASFFSCYPPKGGWNPQAICGTPEHYAMFNYSELMRAIQRPEGFARWATETAERVLYGLKAEFALNSAML